MLFLFKLAIFVDKLFLQVKNINCNNVNLFNQNRNIYLKYSQIKIIAMNYNMYFVALPKI